MRAWYPELGSDMTWTPIEVPVVHFGTPVEEVPQKYVKRPKQRYTNNKHKRRKLAGWRR